MNSDIENPIVLDATAGPRGIWFNKNHPSAVFIDVRKEVRPTVVADDKALPFRSGVFNCVVFDPPHDSHNPSSKSLMGKRYGKFTAQQIRALISLGSREFYRVLRIGGFLLFKWNDRQFKLKEVLVLLDPRLDPLFGQRTASRMKHRSDTYWICLRKRKNAS